MAQSYHCLICCPSCFNLSAAVLLIYLCFDIRISESHNSNFALKFSILYLTRKPVVTGRNVVLFLSIFGSQFLSHHNISVTTKHTAELTVKHVKHNVITTKSIKMALVNLCTCRFVYSVAIILTTVTMQSFAFYLICT